MMADQVDLFGRDPRLPEGLVYRPDFLPAEEERSAPVVVLNEPLAEGLFGGTNPVGQYVRLRGERFRVVGVYREEANIFSAAVNPSFRTL